VKTPDFVKIAEHIKHGRNEMEPVRIRWLCAYMAAAFCGAVGIGTSALVFAMAQTSPMLGWGTSGLSVVLFIVLAFRSSALGEQLSDRFARWRESAVLMLDGEASFAAHKGLGQAEFDRSGLNNCDYNRYSCNSFLGVGVSQCSYVHAAHERTETYYETEYYTDSQGHQQSRQVQKTRQVFVKIFSGLLVKHLAPLPKGGALMLRSKRTGLPNGWQQLHVASPELQNNYAIGATDAFAGHRTLTPSFMVRLWNYSSSFKYLPSYAYRDGWLYLLIPNYWLSFGGQPSKWTAITGVGLQQCLDECQASIQFLRNGSKALVPDQSKEPLAKVAR
jgi:hypothetical protein